LRHFFDAIGKAGVPKLSSDQIAVARSIRTMLEGIFKVDYPWLWFAFIPVVDGKKVSTPQFVVFDTADNPGQTAPCGYGMIDGYRVMNLACDYYYESGLRPVARRDTGGQCLRNPWKMAPISVADVRSISIRADIARKGFRATIDRKDGRFERSGFDRQSLAAHLDVAEAWLYEARSLPSARAAFESLYFDRTALNQWFQDGWLRPMEHITQHFVDSIDVRIQTSTGTVEISSSSQNRFFLPLYIADAAGRHDDWDPALPASIAAFLPSGMRAFVTEERAFSQWGYDVANDRAVKEVIARDGITENAANAAASERGLAISYQNDDRALPADQQSLWHGWIDAPAFSQIRYEFQITRSTPLSFEAFLDGVRRTLDRLHANEWLASALAHNAGLRAVIKIGQWTPVSWAWTLRRCKLEDAALVLQRDDRAALMFEVDEPDARSHWALLRDGDLMLVAFEGKPAFPYGPGWYANVRQVHDSHYQLEASGVIVEPDGTVTEQAAALRPAS
jgi:hypothetical protein